MKYEVIVKKETVKTIKERTFCFACGCFQGGIKPKEDDIKG